MARLTVSVSQDELLPIEFEWYYQPDVFRDSLDLSRGGQFCNEWLII